MVVVPFSLIVDASDFDIHQTLWFEIGDKPNWLLNDMELGEVEGTASKADLGTREVSITVLDECDAEVEASVMNSVLADRDDYGIGGNRDRELGTESDHAGTDRDSICDGKGIDVDSNALSVGNLPSICGVKIF